MIVTILWIIIFFVATMLWGYKILKVGLTVLMELVGLEITRYTPLIIILVILYIIPFVLKKLKINKFLKLDLEITINEDAVLYYNKKDKNNNSFNRELLSDAIIKKLKVNKILNIFITLLILIAYINTYFQMVLERPLLDSHIFTLIEIALYIIVAFKIYYTKINQIVLDYNYNLDDFAYNKQFYDVLKKNNIIYTHSAQNSGSVYSATTKYIKVKLSNRQLSFISTNYKEDVIRLKEMKAYLYAYPTFIIVRFKSEFAVSYFGSLPISVSQSTDRAFKPPKDSIIIDTTYYYANKDGSRDKRYANNVAIYIYKIGQLILRCGTEDYALNLSNVNTIAELKLLLDKNQKIMKKALVYETNKQVDEYLNNKKKK